MGYPGILCGRIYAKNMNLSFGSHGDDAKLWQLAFAFINETKYSPAVGFSAGICDKKSYKLRIK
jgi:hypothetical protein